MISRYFDKFLFLKGVSAIPYKELGCIVCHSVVAHCYLCCNIKTDAAIATIIFKMDDSVTKHQKVGYCVRDCKVECLKISKLGGGGSKPLVNVWYTLILTSMISN